MDKETRNVNTELRVIPESREVEFYPIVFNSESVDLGGFREVILPEAVEGVFEKSDVLAVMNHNPERGLLARSKYGKGTLKLSVDSTGVLARFKAPKTALGDELLESIEREDVTGASFAFRVAQNGDKWEKREGSYVRTITKFDSIYDVSPVITPAYPQTSIALRKLDEIQKEESDRIELETYYQELINKLNKTE